MEGDVNYWDARRAALNLGQLEAASPVVLKDVLDRLGLLELLEEGPGDTEEDSSIYLSLEKVRSSIL